MINILHIIINHELEVAALANGSRDARKPWKSCANTGKHIEKCCWIDVYTLQLMSMCIQLLLLCITIRSPFAGNFSRIFRSIITVLRAKNTIFLLFLFWFGVRAELQTDLRFNKFLRALNRERKKKRTRVNICVFIRFSAVD